jgi:hypothetical protein
VPATAQTAASSVSVRHQTLVFEHETYWAGLVVDAEWQYRDGFGLVGEFGVTADEHRLFGYQIETGYTTFAAGPRLTARQRTIRPFIQMLAGGFRRTASFEGPSNQADDATTAFMLQPGAGIQVALTPRLGIVGTADYRRLVVSKHEGGDAIDDSLRTAVGMYARF